MFFYVLAVWIICNLGMLFIPEEFTLSNKIKILSFFLLVLSWTMLAVIQMVIMLWMENMKVPFVDYKMAGVFAFFNEPINAVKLSEIFPHEHISVSGWNNVLKALSPLLIANDDNYTILHNDIRVYLSAFRVLKEYQGKGLGQNLLNFVIKDLEAKGYTEFTIGVEDDNENALHIYKKFGFNKIIARLNEEYEGNSYEYNLYLREGGKCNGVC